MRRSIYYFSPLDCEDQPLSKRFFFKFFKSKGGQEPMRNPGAIPPEELKKKIIALGRGKKVNVIRLSYDGLPEDNPVAIKIIDIGDDHFTGKVVNVDREVSESQDKKVIYIKGGGGTIDFMYNDGDIMSVEEDIDEEIVEERSIDNMREVLEALDLNDEINISYFDRAKGGVINGAGMLVEKDMDTLDFKVVLKIINEIELKQDEVVKLNLEKDQILDMEIVI
ncbi:MAG: hypothetical protein E4H13_03220 [Calditrichales bacterium]|nr:MAG: hypothetical protein E4H13_03220 [Calditrichales bacterium]